MEFFQAPCKKNNLTLIIILLLQFALGCSLLNASEPKSTVAKIAPLLEGMGEHIFTVNSEDPLVNSYFNQAIALTYGLSISDSTGIKLS